MNEPVAVPAVLAVRVCGVRKGYGNDERRVEVLRGVDLALKQGEMLALVGPSGVGKSTFLHLLGLLDQPEAGKIELFGQDAGAMSPVERASWRNRRIGFVFQFHGLLAEFTLTENVAMPLLIGGASRREAMARARDLLAVVGLEHRREHFPDQLSGGEQQRGAIARALIADPWLLLADEPTGNLDSATAEAVFELLCNLHLERGLSSVIVTHNGRLAARCHRTLRLSGEGLEVA
ncbi:MAG: ABC transporter ATP-binding protein [Thermoanaerobaculaceae bacterium]|nr:ABC transporter ATP-binding protein [Thermoanaerobaculaceae bacterium]MDI9621533.1 ABC transporter ATP-binding protein [Acidobacteriota bacterium]NLH11526.1 ABC transporter ATP-binding protein [Holophagae bacterium]HPW55162.1 ABC transporter ATP-binding protein [Thermoanaerobaculaceae bacterium]